MSKFPSPRVMRGFDSYRSPVTNELIQSRREKELDHLRTDTIPSQDVLVRPGQSIIREENSRG